MKAKYSWFLCLLLLVQLMAGCAASGAEPAAPAPTQSAAASAAVPQQAAAPVSEDGVIRVSTVDEFLAALAPDTVIELAPGLYDLTQASTYGRPTGSLYYRWCDDYMGFGLELVGLGNVTIRGSGSDKTNIVTQPRDVEVLRLKECRDITLEGFTAGHTEDTEYACGSGVLFLEDCVNTTLDGLGLFGCGVRGLWLDRCVNTSLTNSAIYDCSSSGIEARESNVFFVDNCRFYGLGSTYPNGYAVFVYWDMLNTIIQNCEIYDCNTETFLSSIGSQNGRLENNSVHDSVFTTAFEVYGDPLIFEDNGFADLHLRFWFGTLGTTLVDEAGNEISEDTLKALYPDFIRTKQQEAGNVFVQPVTTSAQDEVWVSTADEFLAAIGPNRKILLKSHTLDLSDATNYGVSDGKYYRWDVEFDGAELVIHDVENMTIQGDPGRAGDYVISAVPRYADVLTFENCSNITLSSFTAGHTQEPGYCSGGVLMFENCRDMLVEGCNLYGCGILGVNARETQRLQVKNSCIYECSSGGIQLDHCTNVDIGGCAYWDLLGPTYGFWGCEFVSIDGEEVPANYYGD